MVYVRMEHSNSHSNAYTLVARDLATHEIDGIGIYRIVNRIATCDDMTGTERARTAIHKAAQGLLRWRGAKHVSHSN